MGGETRGGVTGDLAGGLAGDTVLSRLYECKICMSAPVTGVFLPCGHTIACTTCPKRLRQCPVCTCTITQKTQIYFL